jgi:hypothetical protein
MFGFNMNTDNRCLTIEEVSERLFELRNEKIPKFSKFWIMVYSLQHKNLLDMEYTELESMDMKDIAEEIFKKPMFMIHEGHKWFSVKVVEMSFDEVNTTEKPIPVEELKQKIIDALNKMKVNDLFKLQM